MLCLVWQICPFAVFGSKRKKSNYNGSIYNMDGSLKDAVDKPELIRNLGLNSWSNVVLKEKERLQIP